MKIRAQKLRNKKNIGALIIILIICLLIFIFFSNSIIKSDYIPIKPIAIHNNGSGFSGSKVCAECHLDIYNSHIKTTHYKSSAKANLENVKGNFNDGKNIFHLNDAIAFKMNLRNDSLYQDIFIKLNDSLINSSRFDAIIGSGTKGQSYLNWQDSSLYQIQVSYFAPNKSWINSPGYPPKRLASNRPVQQRCLECHVTYAKNSNSFGKKNVYYKSKIIYGIDCERCHGPSLKHVNFHKKNPEDTIGMFAVKYSNLSRQQKLDACALCHSGIRMRGNKNPFSFIVGDTLNLFSMPDYTKDNLKNLDVHGNQYGLLSASKCFKKSNTMDCTTCHNPHKNQRNDYTSFNEKCFSCHNTKENHKNTCSAEKKATNAINNNCIECHMPLVSSKKMKIQTLKDSLKSVKVRTHFIAVYTDSLLSK